MNCKHCNTGMKALLTSTYCPNDCKDNPLSSFLAGLPAIRRDRVFPLIMNQLIEVQPMTEPSGLLFYLDYQFDYDDKAQGGRTTDGKVKISVLGGED